MNAKPLGLLVVGTVFCVFGTSVATAQAVHEKQVFIDPFEITLRADLLSECLQEDVHLSGTLKTTIQITATEHGYHEKVGQVTDVTGVGLVSGATYRASGPLSYTLYTPDGEISRAEHYHNIIIHVVGPGGAANMLLLQTLQLTTNANGEVVVERSVEFEARCPTS